MKKLHRSVLPLIFIIFLTACRAEKVDVPPTLTVDTPTPPAKIAAPTPLAPTSTPAPIAPIATPAPHLSLGIVGHVDSLNPLLNLNPALAAISPLMFPSLNQLEVETSRPQPYAAKLPVIAADNLTLTYTLRLTNITVTDVKASIETAIQPELDDIRKVEIVDENQVRISLTEPNCALINALGQLPILPQSQVTADTPTGLLPYTMQAWGVDSQTLGLVATQNNAPAAQITVQFFDDMASAQESLAAKLLDKIIKPPSLQFIAFNNQRPPFDDAKLRHALSLAIDSEMLVSNFIGKTFSKPMRETVELVTPLPFNPDAARTELDALGITDRDGDGWRELPDSDSAWDVAVAVDVNREDLQAIAFWVAQYYRDVGIKARVELLPFSTLIDDLLTRDYQTAVYNWQIGNPSNLKMRWHTDGIDAEVGQNIAGYSNSDVDALIDSLDTVPHCDTSARAKIIREINQFLTDERPVSFFWGFDMVK